MIYRIFADLVLLLHAAFVLFVIFGGLLALWKRWLAWLHVPALMWGAVVVGMGWICPLTPLENRFRSLAGGENYQNSFLEQYLLVAIYPQGLTREIQILMSLLLIVGNLIVYAIWCRRGETSKSQTREFR
ncbi:DUF2784 domain-containing protein [Candidimonas sp. SYP-B2681]|uniref:DUF2784 domain-containing protein n=1 Tax=Candidimonas sp. SYP-B2681 TaxID=2497686 RepID=UPI000F85EB74|nr:DUF2784 domain-containing protein [Candidimonas sp. SYP-B2681]RTZ44732.1 DUF2784 domain-containing protein [Candidimonas sp. SYP-B2681]